MQNQSRIEKKIIIIDFGSQVTKLIARRIRELGVFSEILTIKELKKIENFTNVKGIILSEALQQLQKKYIKIPKSIYLKKNSNFRNLLWFTTYS